MQQSTDFDRVSTLDAAAQIDRTAYRLQRPKSALLPPVAIAILGVFSFLTCGAAVVAAATLVALNVQ